MAGGLDFWVPGSKAPDVLVWRRLGLETQERGSLAPQKEGSWDFALLSFGREKGGRGWWGCGCLQTQSHGSPGSRLQGVRSLEAQTPGSRMESWAGQGHECLCPPVGRENWGTGCQSPWRVRDDSSGFLGTTVGT